MRVRRRPLGVRSGMQLGFAARVAPGRSAYRRQHKELPFAIEHIREGHQKGVI